VSDDGALTVGSRAQREDLASRGGRVNRAKSRVQAALARHPRIYPAALALHVAYGKAVGRLHELPNAYIIGFQRCGTTALYSYLAQHPDVMAGFAKEARYFEDAARHARGINWYRSNAEGLDFAQAIEAEESRVAGEYERMERDESYYSVRYFGYAYARGGLYARMLEPWAKEFGDRLLVVESESLRADAQGTVDRVADFLGMERREVADTRERNVGGGGGIDPGTRGRLVEYYRGPNRDLEALLGRRLAWGGG